MAWQKDIAPGPPPITAIDSRESFFKDIAIAVDVERLLPFLYKVLILA
jgi:hypothetical protein